MTCAQPETVEPAPPEVSLMVSPVEPLVADVDPLDDPSPVVGALVAVDVGPAVEDPAVPSPVAVRRHSPTCASKSEPFRWQHPSFRQA